MTVLALITTARCADLTALCVDSLKQYAPQVTRLILVNQFDRALRRWLAQTGEVYFVNDHARGDGSDHAGAIETVRASGCVESYGADLIVLVDNDCVILSPQWYQECVKAFDDPSVAVWGAQHIKNVYAVHASMLAMRAVDFRHATTFHSMLATWQPGQPWWDTGGKACDELLTMGFRLETIPRQLAGGGWATYWSGEH